MYVTMFSPLVRHLYAIVYLLRGPFGKCHKAMRLYLLRGPPGRSITQKGNNINGNYCLTRDTCSIYFYGEDPDTSLTGSYNLTAAMGVTAVTSRILEEKEPILLPPWSLAIQTLTLYIAIYLRDYFHKPIKHLPTQT